MKRIDFLLDSYSARVENRKAYWRVVALGIVIGGSLALMSVLQLTLKAHAAQQRQQATIQFHSALSVQCQLEQFKVRLGEERQAAELLAFLDHPWPKTQLLKALADYLPPDMELKLVHIRAEQQPRNDAPAHDPGATPSNKSQADLALLASEVAARRNVVILVGDTPNPAQVHEYAFALRDFPLCRSVKLESCEIPRDDRASRTTFRLCVELRSSLEPREVAQVALRESSP